MYGIPVPRYAFVNRDKPYQELEYFIEEEDFVEVHGQRFWRPFVEKPVHGDDHRIMIYYPSSAGGGMKELFRKVRRGADRVDIYSLAFSTTAERLAVSSDRGTIHVFNLKVDSGSMQTISDQNSWPPPVVSHLSFIKGVLPKYFSSEWSVARVHLNEGMQYVCWFWSPEEHSCDSWNGRELLSIPV